MTRSSRQLGVFVLLLGVVWLVRLPYGPVRPSWIASLRDAAQRGGVALDVGELTLRFPAVVEGRDIGLLFPGEPAPFPVLMHSVSARLAPLRLFLLSADFAVDGSLYGGTVRSHVAYPFFGGVAKSRGSAEGIDLGAHPVLAALGVGGELELDYSLEQSPRNSLSLRAKVSKGSFGGYRPLGVAAVGDIEAALECVSADSEMSLKSFTVSSSAGRVTGAGTFRLQYPDKLERADLRFEIDLTEEGKKNFGPFLILASRASAAGTKWSATFRQNLGGQPVWRISPR